MVTPKGAVVVGVESAYLAPDPPKGREPRSFRSIVEQTRRTVALLGLAPRGRI